MASHYQNVFGWFEFMHIYEWALGKFDNCLFVELGSFQGKSAIYMGERIRELNKNIKMVCVDIWPSVQEVETKRHLGAGQLEESSIIGGLDKPLMEVFIQNVNNAKLDNIIIPVRAYSTLAASLFQDGTIPFIFVDAGHSYDQVMQDLKAWYPKLTQTCYFGGHDYHDDLKLAVDEFFKDKGGVRAEEGRSWFYERN